MTASKKNFAAGIAAVISVAALALPIAILRTRLRSELGPGLHGASQSIETPVLSIRYGQKPTAIGWLKNGDLWLLDAGMAFRTAVSPYTNFSNDANSPILKNAGGYRGVTLSPDGKWAASTVTTTRGDALIWPIGGGKKAIWTSPLETHSWWKQDSSGVYSLATDGASIYRLIFTPIPGSAGKPKTIDLANMLSAYGDILSTADTPQVSEFPDGKLYFYYGGPDINTWVVDPTQKTSIQKLHWTPFNYQRSNIADPTTCRWVEVALSPDGKHLAWICHTEKYSRFSTFAYFKLKIGQMPKPSITSEVHVTDLNGNNDVRLAWAAGDSKQMYEPITYLQWLPDGRHVSVYFNNKIYLIAFKSP